DGRFSEIGCLRKLPGRFPRGASAGALGAADGGPDAADGARVCALDALGARFSEIGCLRKLPGRFPRGASAGALGTAVGTPVASDGSALGVASGALGALDGPRFSEI